MSGLYDMADYLIYRGYPVRGTRKGGSRTAPTYTPPMMDIRFMHDRLGRICRDGDV